MNLLTLLALLKEKGIEPETVVYALYLMLADTALAYYKRDGLLYFYSTTIPDVVLDITPDQIRRLSKQDSENDYTQILIPLNEDLL